MTSTILFDIKSQISIEKRFKALESDLSKANVNFDVNLIEKYPDLTKTEREICFYIRLNFSIKEISQIRSVTIGSVKMGRSRIRRKLNLSSKEELDKVIQLL
ncbi:MAG: hypothetical protein JKY02_08525 [Flavobacteriaceae bacterium]|nr:hypothetical protein [Flavobacteriaceae bacterium]